MHLTNNLGGGGGELEWGEEGEEGKELNMKSLFCLFGGTALGFEKGYLGVLSASFLVLSASSS